MSEKNTENKETEKEKPKAKNQVFTDKVGFITDRGWNQTKAGNQRTDLVWTKNGQLANLESAYAMERLREKGENATGSVPPGGDSKQGQKTIPPLTEAQKKEIADKSAADKKKGSK